MTPKTIIERQEPTSGVIVVDPSVSHDMGGYIRRWCWWSRPLALVAWQRHPTTYDVAVITPPDDDPTWLGISDEPLPVALASDWAVQPRCGAVVMFSGTARDHAPGRQDVELLEYEAYEEQVVPRLAEITEHMREQWAELGRIVILHRVGVVPIGESAVVVVAASPHRGEAFEAARYAIDTLKATVPIWKRETWSGGRSWGLEAQHIVEVDR